MWIFLCKQLKTSVGQGLSITKDDFRERLRKARSSQYVTDREVDLLFPIFDVVKDGLLSLEDFSSDEASRWDRGKDKELNNQILPSSAREGPA
jgi:hypothetical protein